MVRIPIKETVMRAYVLQYIVALVVFLAIDVTWLSLTARSFYAAEIGPILRDSPNLPVALLFYLLFVFALLVFVISPAIARGAIGEAIMMGGLLGLVCYGTYDLTNLASMKGFTAKVAIVDMVWGTSVAGAVSGITVALAGYFKLLQG
jgi:uncharacterized membrane protein